MFPGPLATQQGALEGNGGVGPVIAKTSRFLSTSAKLSGLWAGVKPRISPQKAAPSGVLFAVLGSVTGVLAPPSAPSWRGSCRTDPDLSVTAAQLLPTTICAAEGSIGLTDPSAAQIVVGKSWAAVTLKSGSVLQLPLRDGALGGASTPVALPSTANNTPPGAAFWGDILGFTPAHSPDSFALVDRNRDVFPITGPTPPFPSNAPCWVAKGPGNIWYTANSPAHAISIFLADGAGGVFYKSIPLPGAPTDITVSRDGKWLAVIYSAGGSGYVAVYAIDAYGDLTPAATSSPVGVAGFSGAAISE